MIEPNIWLITFVIFILLWVEINTERIYPLVSDMEPLLQTQERVINDLGNIILRKREALDFIKNEIERYENEHEKLEENTTNYLGNPFNSLSLMKRVSIDLEFIENITQEDMGLNKHASLKYPSHEDLEEAAGIILRLQHVYRLNTTQLADGILNTSFGEGGQKFTEHFLPMTSNDCFELSKQMNKEVTRKNQKLRLLWLYEALRKFTRGEFDNGFNKFDISQKICESYDALDDSENYLKWTQKLLDMKPSYNTRLIERKIKRHETRIREKQESPHQEINMKKIGKPLIDPKEEIEPCIKGLDRKVFRLLCRGEVSVPREVAKSLKCWYYVGHHPFARLAPFKAEQLYIKPDVFLFHDVLSGEEIDTIKRIALSDLDITESMSYRLCKGAQINENQTAGIEQVGQRIADFTGLAAPITMTSVSNYGVGGFYLTHVDSMSKLKNDENTLKWRELFNEIDDQNVNELVEMSKQLYRIATVVFYLSDVEQGGATVFPALGLTVFPVKGAALFWTNLLPSLDVDYTTCHGACPVLRGSKWVASKWINAENQELIKPCTDKTTSREPQYVPFPEVKN